MNRTLLLGLLAIAVLAEACGPNCQSTCNRIYSSSEDGCGITRPGKTTDELVRECLDQCEAALAQPGHLEGYDPDERAGSSGSVKLDNEAKAAVWMDCVAETACEDLKQGYCAPIW